MDPRSNKGCAYTEEERDQLGLRGRLPQRVETLEQQVERHYQQFLRCPNDLAKNIMLGWVLEKNQTLFYALIKQHLEEMLPIVYTPTVGEAVQRYSHELRMSRGLYVNYPDREKMDEILDHRINEEIDLIVVTDGEGVLGIGDQGIGGMEISVAKLMVYTACGGVDPNRVLPVALDVGTNNPSLLQDPMYLGWRHPRLEGGEYDAFIDQFVQAVRKKFPGVYLHWEDFGRENARKNLDRYKDEMCTFNDDMQGTGATALACLLSALQVTGGRLADQRVVFFGAGTAGCGIADQICSAMVQEGLSQKEAYRRFWMLDRPGLLTDDMSELAYFQRPYARSARELAGWDLVDGPYVGLLDVVHNIQPTVLIGCSTVHGAFNEEIVRTMASQTNHPIIFPLSNPLSKSEAEPKDLLAWTNGKALIAAGSPYEPVDHVRISQANNAFVFPGLGLGVIASKARRVTGGMLAAACQALANCSPARENPSAPLLPAITEVEHVSKVMALAVAEQAAKEGVADPSNFAQRIEEIFWRPTY